MSTTLERLRALRWQERRQLILLLALLPLIQGLLATLGYVRSRRLLEHLSPARQPAGRTVSDPERRSAEQLAALAEIAGRRGAITATCLRQSLAVYWLLRWRRLAPSLQVGVRRAEGQLDAHAWVELDQRPLSSNGREYARFGAHAP